MASTTPLPRLVRINLLAHREQRLQKSRQAFQRLLTAIFGTGVTVALGMLTHLNMQHDTQRQRTQLLLQEQQLLDQQVTQVALLKKELNNLSEQMRQLEQLQQQRNDAVRLLAQLAQFVPTEIQLRALKQDARHISLHGQAASPQDITRLLERLRQTDTLANAQLRHTTQTGNHHQFIITAVVSVLQSPS